MSQTLELQTFETNRVRMKKGSKTFFWAALFFSAEQQKAAMQLYSWCRHVDDLIDSEEDVGRQLANLQKIRGLTEIALSSNQSDESDLLLHQDPAFFSLMQLHHTYLFPRQLAFDLLRGMEFDCKTSQPSHQEELRDYCYCVAGAVGLIMTHVMGFSSERAFEHAKSLGEAMQLTNIARDLYEDEQKGRCYLPKSLLEEANIKTSDLWKLENIEFLLAARRRLLDWAEERYAFAFEGLTYLSWRSAWAVVLAGFLYRAIGRKALKNKEKSLKTRTVISTPHKILISLHATVFLVYKKLSSGVRIKLSMKDEREIR